MNTVQITRRKLRRALPYQVGALVSVATAIAFAAAAAIAGYPGSAREAGGPALSALQVSATEVEPQTPTF